VRRPDGPRALRLLAAWLLQPRLPKPYSEMERDAWIGCYDLDARPWDVPPERRRRAAPPQPRAPFPDEAETLTAAVGAVLGDVPPELAAALRQLADALAR
jgi:hypothetical protein